jgi:hypothetical protein
MADPKFTPGPWYVNDLRATTMRKLGWKGPAADIIHILDRTPAESVKAEGRGCVIARISYEGMAAELQDEHMHDAHLIAAAPCLYEALRTIRDLNAMAAMSGYTDAAATTALYEANALASAALARAIGETR